MPQLFISNHFKLLPNVTKPASLLLCSKRHKQDEPAGEIISPLLTMLRPVTPKCRISSLLYLRWFGDVLAFDAMYRTNRYNMVFVPFTGMDHHNKCVTFGGGLLKHETIESYEWLLKAFLTAHPNQPQLVLTDQDPAMKEAITNVFTESTHRLCMWHVMKKLPKKVCGELLKNTDLRKRIHKLVWDVLLTKEKFESQWQSLISEFNLEENTWLADKFKIRDRWVPGYFSHLLMCRLMKTTSRAESSNAFFRIFTDPDLTLVQFMLNFESAMDKQRHEHHVLDYQTKKTTPCLVTELKIEGHAASVYTLAIFEKVQKEIYRGLYFYSHKVVTSDDVAEVYEIQDVNMKTKVVSRHQVVLNKDGNIVCSCNHFGRHGWLCRHIFCVFNNIRVEEIPEIYIKRRWRRDILTTRLLDKRHGYGMQNDETSIMCSQVISDVKVIVSRLKKIPQQLFEFAEFVKKNKDDVLVDIASQSAEKNTEEEICELLDVTIPDEIQVRPPRNINNKGSRRKRMVGQDEKYANKRKKQFRECKNVVNTRLITIHAIVRGKKKRRRLKSRSLKSNSRIKRSRQKKSLNASINIHNCSYIITNLLLICTTTQVNIVTI
ncbi:protein FAR1-RELATED SEQUENCE 5-like [Rutidosis leptorrhynchoides]|uniref:protein FAR1-RELATED SEQUENCE 5-like n=1 Tax=Rutidosis leptorrhynchoides TaxID=125765 RepID=UPI003A99D2E7